MTWHNILQEKNNEQGLSKFGQAQGESIKAGFDSSIKLEFHGAKVTSDGVLFAYHELEDALRLFDSGFYFFGDIRTGRNIQHNMTTLLCQEVICWDIGTDRTITLLFCLIYHFLKKFDG